MSQTDISGYVWDSAECTSAHSYILPTLIREINKIRETHKSRAKIFELGCGNGSIANALSKEGYQIVGVDPSLEGVGQANSHFPLLKLEVGSAYDDLASLYGQFPLVTSLEVVEHVYAPRQYMATLFSLVEPGGFAFISTPYHGYWKNLALALLGKTDDHYTALWDHGHIKFWSIRTLTVLLQEAGFTDISFKRVGRIPPLAKSMIAIARRP